jgi:hypothetical protein
VLAENDLHIDSFNMKTRDFLWRLGFDYVARRSVIRVSSDGRPSRSAKPGHSPVPLFT